MLAATGGDEQTHIRTMLEISGAKCTEERNALLQCLQELSSVLDWTRGFSIHQQVFDAIAEAQDTIWESHAKTQGQLPGPAPGAPVGRG